METFRAGSMGMSGSIAAAAMYDGGSNGKGSLNSFG
jgi:hypothetical protein